MTLLDKFIEEFKPKLTAPIYAKHQFNRWPAFEFIARELLSKDSITILETGTLNTTNDWLGYGQATIMWNWIIRNHTGLNQGYSIDIDKYKCEKAQNICKNMRFIESDSILYLRTVPPASLLSLNLLYLDSFDWSKEQHLSSSLHHMGELAACYDKLPSGCLIAVDDCHSDTEGKHVLVKYFFKNMLNQEPLIKCHINVWRKY